jgi:hypothetical protein
MGAAIVSLLSAPSNVGRDREILTFQPHLSLNDFAGLAPALVTAQLVHRFG